MFLGKGLEVLFSTRPLTQASVLLHHLSLLATAVSSLSLAGLLFPRNKELRPSWLSCVLNPGVPLGLRTAILLTYVAVTHSSFLHLTRKTSGQWEINVLQGQEFSQMIKTCLFSSLGRTNIIYILYNIPLMIRASPPWVCLRIFQNMPLVYYISVNSQPHFGKTHFQF